MAFIKAIAAKKKAVANFHGYILHFYRIPKSFAVNTDCEIILILPVGGINLVRI